MITLSKLHDAFIAIDKIKMFEIETTEGYDLVDLSISENGLKAISEYGVFEVDLNGFDYCITVHDMLDTMLNDLYVQVISKHLELGILD